MITIYLVRHGQTDSNKNFRYQGKINNPLNEVGKKQAEDLAKRFSNIKLDAIYASPLIRAIETAKPLANLKNLDIVQIKEFEEINFGKWEGLTYDEIHKKWPENIDNFFLTPKTTKVIGGESFQDVMDRAFPKLKEIILMAKDNDAIAIITHGGVVRALECAMINIDLNKVWKMRVDNCSVTTLECKGENDYSLINYNNVDRIE